MLIRFVLYILVFVISAAVCAKVHSRIVRQTVLLIGSYTLFASWEVWFAAVLLASTLMNYGLGKRLRNKPGWPVLATGILLNVLLLSVFKYLPELAVNVPVPSLKMFSRLVLPLGMSFWTFQAMSYLFDTYRDQELDPSLMEFALYMSFFPVAISGPICRMPDMLPQFRAKATTRWNEIARGLARIATGVFMMQLGRLLGQGILAGDGIDNGFDRLNQWSAADVWCLAFGFGLQLFFDFAGYSHIAIGAAQALGFTVPENFARPFHSTSPSIFWTRWHMSLSFWIRDYVFLPLAVLRREVWWPNLALLISMVLFGLWHKASLLFIAWGCYHGMLLVLHRQMQELQRKFDWHPPAFWNFLSWLATIGLVSLGWIFFRADSLRQAKHMLGAVVSPGRYGSHLLSGSLYGLVLALGIGYIGVLVVRDVLDTYSEDSRAGVGHGILSFIARWRWFWLPPLYAVALILLSIITLTRGANTAQLMYRRF